jgi:hypothetical protein
VYTWTAPDGMVTITRKPNMRAQAIVKIEGLFEATFYSRVESRIQVRIRNHRVTSFALSSCSKRTARKLLKPHCKKAAPTMNDGLPREVPVVLSLVYRTHYMKAVSWSRLCKSDPLRNSLSAQEGFSYILGFSIF